VHAHFLIHTHKGSLHDEHISLFFFPPGNKIFWDAVLFWWVGMSSW
jgi:hypothetical protein